MQKNTKNNKYKFGVYAEAYIITEDLRGVMKVTVLKRLKRPYRLSDNFYFCEWKCGSVKKNGIRYEAEMFKTFDEAEAERVIQLTSNTDESFN